MWAADSLDGVYHLRHTNVIEENKNALLKNH